MVSHIGNKEAALPIPPKFKICTPIKTDNPPFYISILLRTIRPESLVHLAKCMSIPDTHKLFSDICNYDSTCILQELAYEWYHKKRNRCWEELEWIAGECLWHRDLAKQINALYKKSEQ